jgi:hypothetical protein
MRGVELIGSILPMKHNSIKINQRLNANYAFYLTTEVKQINPKSHFHFGAATNVLSQNYTNYAAISQ